MENRSATQQIDTIIKTNDGWKGEMLSRLRVLIKQTDSDVIEEIKWKTPSRPEGLPVWSHNGILCIAEIWKDNIKLIFFKGARMKDPKGLFNARFRSKTDRAIEFQEGDAIDETALKELVLEAMEINESTTHQK